MENYLTLFETYDVPAAFWANIQLTFWAAIWATLLGTLICAGGAVYAVLLLALSPQWLAMVLNAGRSLRKARI